MQSLPSRERGLKSRALDEVLQVDAVAPLAGAWIEIATIVLPVGAPASLPSRERGLKSFLSGSEKEKDKVAPLAGAWIEI